MSEPSPPTGPSLPADRHELATLRVLLIALERVLLPTDLRVMRTPSQGFPRIDAFC